MKLQSIITAFVYLGWITFFPALAGKFNNADAQEAKLIFSRLYRNPAAPEIEDFSANFYVKMNPAPKAIFIDNEEDLVPLSEGRLYFKKPYKLRVETRLHYPPGLEGADFVEIRDGKYIYAFKNGLDLPIGEDLDDPTQPSNYIPFGLQLPLHPRDAQFTLLGKNQSMGTKTILLGLMDRTDPYHDVTKIWVDARHYFVRQTEWYGLGTKKSTTKLLTDSGAVTLSRDVVYKVTTIYKDPLELPNGYWIPMRIERYENWDEKPRGIGTLAQLVVYSRATVNSNLADALFQVPDYYNAPLFKFTGIHP